MRIARFAKGDGVAYGVVEGEPESGGRPPRPGLTIADTFVQDLAFVAAPLICAHMFGRVVRAWQFGPPRTKRTSAVTSNVRPAVVRSPRAACTCAWRAPERW